MASNASTVIQKRSQLSAYGNKRNKLKSYSGIILSYELANSEK